MTSSKHAYVVALHILICTATRQQKITYKPSLVMVATALQTFSLSVGIAIAADVSATCVMPLYQAGRRSTSIEWDHTFEPLVSLLQRRRG